MKQITIVGSVVAGFLLLGSCSYAYPKYKVYAATQSGIAKLKESESSKQILIQQALAEREAAKYQAEAIEIMGEAAKKYPEYRQQEFINSFGAALKDGKIQQIIYVPTEANIPIMESGKHTQVEVSK